MQTVTGLLSTWSQTHLKSYVALTIYAVSAVLKASQKEVVIKVLKPGVEDTLLSDLNFLAISSQILEFLNPSLARTSLAGIVADIR